MTVLYLEALGALAPSVLMAGARVVQQRTGNSSRVDTMRRSCGERYRDYQLSTCMFFPLPPQKGVVT
jgi:steroid 5-alpha reductase family enzyme